MSLEFTLVRRAIRLAVIDGPDTGDNPDILQAQGSVLFEPVIKKGDSIQVQTRGGSETYALAPIECPINDGIISHRGQDGVKLPAGGEAANPSLIRWKATFSRMQAGGKSFTLAPVIFDAVPGGEIDLTMVAPVAGAPEGVVRGPRGTSLESIIVDGSELVFTAVDDAGSFEIARIPLDDVVRAEAEAAADGVRDALAVDVAASQSARDAAEGHANRAATSESNAKTSETNAKQSEDNAGDYAAVATTAATEAVDAMGRATEIVGGDFATREYVDSTNWYRGVRPSSVDVDTVLENGEHIFTSGATNAPAPGIGTLLVVGSTSYKIQTWNRMGNNVTFTVLRRYYSGGKFTPWQQLTMRQLPVSSSGDLNSLVKDGYYPINTTSAANQPSSNTGILWVVEHSTSVYQQFTDSEGGLFLRHKTPSGWKEWKSLGVDTLKLKDEIKTEVKGEINAPTRSDITPATLSRSDVNQASYPATMTADRTIYFNGQHSYGTARYSEDLGATWKNLKVFHGSFNFMEEVGDGELIARITGEERNEIWRSIGWPELKEQCEWEKVLEVASPGVYFTNSWGVSIHKNIVLIAEYGPKYVPEALPGIPKQDTAEGENARYLNLSLDYGKTFRRILDINEYATSRKGDAINVHLHGVAWDPWWDRIWVTCGDGGGAFLYSDDMGATWHTAWDGWAANASGGNGHQCVGIVPMPTCVLFATDSTPNGVMRINRSEGKHEGTYSPESAYMIPEDPGRLSHLAQRAYRVDRDTGDYLAMFAFGTETMPGKSFALATYDGKNFERFWQDDQEVGVGRGARTMIGPTLDGKVFIGSNDRRTSNMWGLWQGKFNGY